MATTIVTYFDDEVTLTSNIGTVRATTTKNLVEAEVIRSPGNEDDVIYNTTLFSWQGEVELYGVGKLIDDRLRELGITHDRFAVCIDGVSVELVALCCEYVLDSSFDPMGSFLTAAPTSVVHLDSRIHLTHLPDGNDEYMVQAVGIGPDGMRSSVSHGMSSPPEIDGVVSEILNFALDQRELRKVAYFAITHGMMQKIYFLAEDPAYISFRFKNIFNATEYVDVVGSVTRKTKAEREMAVGNGRAIQYNRSVNRTYEVETAALTEDQAKEIEQLIISNNVQLCSANKSWDILIEDHNCEVSDDDNQLTSMKFSFRLADKHAAEPLDALPPKVRVFNNKFNTVFG